MNPQQPLPPDYLDQIAPQVQKHSFLMNKTLLIILSCIGAIAVVIVLALVVGMINSSRKEPWQRLSLRLAATSEVAASSEGKIKNSQLRSTNSTVTISITNAQRDIAEPLSAIGITPKEIPTSVTSSESSAAMLARLEDARLNAKYDSTYAREMSFQLSNLLTLLRQTYASSSNEMNKKFLMTTYDNFAPLQKSLAEFSASNE
jgi:predicted outer membrane protein